jgi:hypothetical protein
MASRNRKISGSRPAPVPAWSLVGGLASVEKNGEQMRNGGLAGGPATALANAQRRRNEDDQGAYTTESLEGGNMQYAIGIGLGVHTKPKPRKPRKPSYDPIEFGRKIEVAVSGFFESGNR